MPAPLFIAQIAALQLQALITQQGVLSAVNFRVLPLAALGVGRGLRAGSRLTPGDDRRRGRPGQDHRSCDGV